MPHQRRTSSALPSIGQASPRPRALAVAISTVFASAVYANPNGAFVVHGSMGPLEISNNGKDLTIRNIATGTIVNWEAFSIQKDEITRLILQHAGGAMLNRVVGQNPSQILGTLQSNGRIFLINPSGITFGAGAVIDVGGLVASTLRMSDADFLSGRFAFSGSGSEGAIRIEGANAQEKLAAGTIRTPEGGHVYLIAPQVENSGVITAPNGEVIIAAGKSVEFVNARTPDIRVEYTADGKVSNAGEIVAASGHIGIYGTLIKNSGRVSASRAELGDGGKIVFKAVKDVTLDATSRVEATGAKGGEIKIQGETGTLLVQGVVEAKGEEEKGGEIQLLARQVGLIGRAHVDASGERGGGTVLVGGDYQGRNADVPNAEKTYVGRDVVIKADAGAEGDGGKVVLWADDSTQFHGSISARGGSRQGDGGFVEVSGKHQLVFRGDVDTSAPNGAMGSLLLDPDAIVIKNLPADDVGAPNDTDVADGSVIFTDGGTGTFTISAGKLESLAAGTNISLQANNTITMEALTNPNVATNATLTLDQTGTVAMTTTNGAIDLNSGNTILLTGGGSLTLSAGTNITTGAITSAGGAVNLTAGTSAGTGTLTTGAITTTGTTGGAGATGGNGGAVNLTGDSTITVGTITTTGGTGGAGNPGGTGGNGGNVLISGSGGAISTQAITTTGGTGGAGAAATNNGGTGGNAGTITITATGGTSSVTTNGQALTANGGTGGAADGAGATSGTGGNGSTINVSSAAAGITVGNVSNVGGNAGATTNGATAGGSGTGASITLNAAAALALNGSIAAMNQSVSLTGNGVTLAGAQTVNSGTGALSVNAGSGALTLHAGSLLLTTGSATLTADDMALNATSQVGGSGAGAGNATAVTLKQSTNTRQIDLGTETGGQLSLTDAELDVVRATALTVGDANSGTIAVSAAVSPANVTNNSLVTGGNISFGAAGALTSTGAATLTANAGAIVGNNSATTNVTATSLTASAANGIGSADTLTTSVATITATNSTSGNISITEANGVDIAGMTISGGSGSISLTTTAGSITTSGAITANGSGNVTLNAAGLLTVNAAVSSTSGNLSLTGGTGVTHDANGDLTT
ncbi:MAG TPA: filamentous hemagglutinin N-terminal domain-containing protein, partial [Vicinamibacterales bacterium]|nr:filamentous hemagglutinin N-terminal domain-containing protein [Vicinamibacterales bacterium]